ncbi:MAG TPA: PAS domain S-box protein [Methanosarcina sp.]|nr:PAS domain S-box protein [Methanosarcina sp.]
MKAKMKQFPAMNPNPVLSVEKNGIVLYSNIAGEPLLHKWGVGVGEKLPSDIVDFVQRVISGDSLEKMEVKVGKSVYSFIFRPFPEDECVNIYGFDISDQKKLGEKFLESEARQKENLELKEIIDTQAIQSLMDDFHKLVHIPIGLNDLKGNVLVGVGWQDICTKFHRIHPETCKHCVESNTILSADVSPGEIKLYKCKNNMWDLATPIMVGDHHIGYVFLGQFFFEDEPLDYELFRSQARKYSFNEEEYIAALEKVPRLSREIVDISIDFFMIFANMISHLSYINTKLSQSLGERDFLLDALSESENRYRMLFDHSTDAVILSDPRDGGKILSANLAACRMLGRSGEELIGKGRDVMLDLKDPEVSCVLDELIRSGTARTQLTYRRKDGTTFLGDISSSLFMDSNGEPRIVVIIRDITERKKTEKELERNEEKYRNIVETTNEGVWVFNSEFETTYVNEKMAGILGYNREEMTGSFLWDYADEKDKGFFQVKLANRKQGIDEVYECKLLQKTGSDVWLLVSAKAFFDKDGKYAGSLGMFTDITERKKAEEALRLSNIYNRSLIEASLDPLVTIGHDGKITDVNGATEKVTGYSRKDLVGTVFSDYFTEPEKARKGYEQVFIDGKVCDYSLRIQHREGYITPVLYNASVYSDEKGEIVGVFAAARDITELEKAKEKIQTLANAVESSDDAIITTSLDGIIESWNKGAEKVYGYLVEEVLGKNISVLEPDNLKGEIKQLVEKIKQGERIQHYETLRLKKDGTIINVSLTHSPVFDTSGELVDISIIARDITDKKIAEKLFQEKQMAEVANRTKSEFLAKISHELRTPLNSIIGFSDMLGEQMYGELNQKQLRYAENISKSGKHLLNLINNILDISKIEAGKMELVYKNFELAAKLSMIRNILYPIANKKNIKIEIDMDSELGIVCADEDKFVQIMYNLVDNAIKFSYENSVVRIGARKKGNMVEITVKDTGIGIKVEDQNKLFKPFSQTDSFSSRKFQGTGLGLSLVKQIVHMHGGYVWFRSNSIEGSTFAFAIPINKNKGNGGLLLVPTVK